MEKLELKHLAPYLPYGLEIYCPNDNHEQIQVLSGLSKDDGIQTDYKKNDSNDCKGNYWAFQGKKNYQYYGIKPLLHPLSRLTEEEFDSLWKNLSMTARQQLLRVDLSIFDIVLRIPHYDFELLVKKHMDVFGLIPKGLAIEKQPLKQ